jgi:hypothetical protein
MPGYKQTATKNGVEHKGMYCAARLFTAQVTDSTALPRYTFLARRSFCNTSLAALMAVIQSGQSLRRITLLVFYLL